MDHDSPSGSKGRRMMLQKLRLYLWWKSKLAERKKDGKSHFAFPDAIVRASDGLDKLYGDESNISEALKKKDRDRADKAASRRRVRGGAPAASSKRDGNLVKQETRDTVLGEIRHEAESFVEL